MALSDEKKKLRKSFQKTLLVPTSEELIESLEE
jgi:hypothetical protein